MSPPPPARPAAGITGGYPYPAPFTRYQLFPDSQYLAFPSRAHGKLYYTIGSTNYQCSGTVVNSAKHWLVETAGHCLYDVGAKLWAANVMFVPAYRNGTAPYGRWAGARLWTTKGWRTSGNPREDRGFIAVAASAGKNIQDVTGGEGIAFSQSYPQHVVAFGYPAGNPFTGQTEQLCLASFEEQDPFGTSAGPVPWGIGCDQAGGSSGGGWVVRYGPSGGYLDGHSDYVYTQPARPLEMFSPYFGNAEKSLWDCASDGTCGNNT